MKALVQRVNSASVLVEGESVGEIKSGCLVLLGIGQEDNKETAEKLTEKLTKLRIFKDAEKKMNLSLLDSGESCLVVSQFTLFANTKKGNRPSFVKAAHPDKAKPIYEHFVSELKAKNIKVQTGKFGAFMNIKLELDGPVTINLEI